MPEDAGLVLFGPALGIKAVYARLCVAAEFADDERLLIANVPDSRVRVLRQLLIPADVFVHADYVERFSERIVHILVVPFGTNQEGRRDQPGWIERAYV